MKLLVTGSNGFVAGSVIAQAPAQWEVYGIARTPVLIHSANFISYELDLIDSDRLVQLIKKIKPDAVIHPAAIANIDFCEKNREIAEQVNTGVTNTIAVACKEAGSKMIFCSTDSVFDGSKGYYTETDLPNPVNVYAETKIKAEQIVMNASPKNVVARLSLVMGLPVMGTGNSFLVEMIEKLKKGHEIKFPENEIRTPVDVITAGSALTELAANDFGGILHLSGNTRVNRYEMAKQIAITLGYSPGLIVPVNSNALPGRAPRSDDASMDNAKAKQILITPMRSLAEGLLLSMHFKIKDQK